ncbi:hypothetical protein MAC_03769 [Metarhizium acridum CQMa 102]|uniref:Secondary alcohol dehydrogenase protein n=1 Tax=Metarhizium acridum (strain CQMa 102) TaxID=655827 RepID=E9E1M1_METAQ|nr:uncharacterized protein MAC_03769 [Metarhizium acridum CQMa 102]EFY90254.1 hypothetical protein MAC_03769 [Metarhizium acridum CQMa 102]
MSADTRPISPGRFATALKDLSVPMLHLKVLEIRNSIAHLQYSNDQLKPFAEGSATALGDEAAQGLDQDCVDAIRENEVVIERMAERIALIRAEVEERGVSWAEFQSKDEVEAAVDKAKSEAQVNGHGHGHGQGRGTHSAWTDGTFQTGTIRDGHIHMDSQPRPTAGSGDNSGGRLNDEELRQAIEERLRDLGNDGDGDGGGDDGGMHL